MKTLRWFQKNGCWQTRCGRFAIEVSSANKYFKLFDNNNRAAGGYSSDSVKEAKQLAERVSAKA